MKKSDLIQTLETKKLVTTRNEEINNYISDLTLENEHQTGITGPIKIYHANDFSKIVVEEDSRNSLYIRLIKTEKIQQFVNERIAVYEKMWDGCGCKIDYTLIWD